MITGDDSHGNHGNYVKPVTMVTGDVPTDELKRQNNNDNNNNNKKNGTFFMGVPGCGKMKTSLMRFCFPAACLPLVSKVIIGIGREKLLSICNVKRKIKYQSYTAVYMYGVLCCVHTTCRAKHV